MIGPILETFGGPKTHPCTWTERFSAKKASMVTTQPVCLLASTRPSSKVKGLTVGVKWQHNCIGYLYFVLQHSVHLPAGKAPTVNHTGHFSTSLTSLSFRLLTFHAATYVLQTLLSHQAHLITPKPSVTGSYTHHSQGTFIHKTQSSCQKKTD